MSWNYRAVRKIFDYDGHEEIAIYSVYYDDNSEIRGMSLKPERVNSYSLEDVEEVLDLMREALQKPILDYEDGLITPDEFMRLPIKRAELIDGVVVELAHRMFADSVIVGTIGDALLRFVKANSLGKVAAGGSFLTGPRNVRMPAISFLSHEDLRGENTDAIIRKAPTLAVEIATPTNDYHDTADEFLAAGTKMVWVVNPRRRTVAVHTPDDIAITYQMGDAIPGGEILPGFELPLADIFED